ncbi:MAG: glycine zipper 2TM domain-containing protein [Sulfuriferula sp.]|jgi:uncharacterized protein YcfJ|nr:glycine zipper 2TM domain-containing protein [Sulfuriferula sp.]
MNINKLKLTALVAAATAANLAWADNATSFTDRAEVMSATPIYQQVNDPRRECTTETVTPAASQEHGYGGAVLGGLVGGLLGSTVGQGNGRIAAAAVGAATGAVVGDKVSNSNSGYNQPQQVEHCVNRDHFHQELSGYNVVYRYQGRTMTATLPQDPGKYVKLDVSVNIAAADREQDNRQQYGNYQHYHDQNND